MCWLFWLIAWYSYHAETIKAATTKTCVLPSGLLLPSDATIEVVGDGALRAKLFQHNEFSIHAYWGNGKRIQDAVFQARLVGPSMIAASITTPTKTKDYYIAQYVVHDPGLYTLEVRVSWLTGALMDHLTLPLITGAFINTTTHVDCVIYRHVLPFMPAIPTNTVPPKKPLCRGGNHPGRWVFIEPGQDCPPHVCEGTASSIAFLNDLFGFNANWVWSPYKCNYRIFSVPAFEQCLVRKGIRSIGFTGDSLVREHFQNLMVFVQQHVKFNEKNFGSKMNDQEYNITMPGGFLLNLDYHLRFDDLNYNHKPGIGYNRYGRYVNGSRYPPGIYDAQVWNVPMLRILIATKPRDMGKSKRMIQWLTTELNRGLPRFRFMLPFERSQLYQNYIPVPDVPAVYYIHPRIQREDPRIIRDYSVVKMEGLAMMTPPRQQCLSDELMRQIGTDEEAMAKATADGLKNPLLVLNGLLPTEARWDSTWDGIHYTILVNKDQMGPKARCGRVYNRGGRNLCKHLVQFPAVNRCINVSAGVTGGVTEPSRVANSNVTDVEGRMEFCRTVVDRAATFTNFEGGVSRMLTMMWMNMICH